MTKRKATGATPGDGHTLVVQAHPGEKKEQSMSRAMVAPYLRHGVVAHAVTKKMFGTLPTGQPQFDDYSTAIKAQAEAAVKGDLTAASEMLASQAVSLDMLFAELARRSTVNMGDFPQAAERYARLAFKAQSNCRATLEALAKLHQPREQTVRHVHVNEGGQAIVADQFNTVQKSPPGCPNSEPARFGTPFECVKDRDVSRESAGPPAGLRQRG